MQEWFAGAVVLGAVAYLVWRWRESRRAKPGCSGCAHASSSSGIRSSSDPAG